MSDGEVPDQLGAEITQLKEAETTSVFRDAEHSLTTDEEVSLQFLLKKEGDE